MLPQKGRRLRKILLITSLAIVSLVAAVIIFISPIAKYLIKKYDVQILGREIELSTAYVNPFTGAVSLSDVKIYEYQSDSVGLSVKNISANLSMHKLLSGIYEIESVTLDQPVGKVIQNKKRFNFSDIIERFASPKVPHVHTPHKKTPLNILNIKIVGGTFYYNDVIPPVYYWIKEVNIESPGWRYDSDTLKASFGFISGIAGGVAVGAYVMTLDSLDYRMDLKLDKLGLKIFEQYLKDFANYGKFNATADADLHVSGNFKDAEAIDMKGKFAINDFHLGKYTYDDYVAFKKLDVEIEEINPKGLKYFFKSISLDKPYVKFEKYDYLDNLQRMFGKDVKNIKAAGGAASTFNLIIEIARYIDKLTKQILNSRYRVDKLRVTGGNLKFNDFSLREEFSVSMNPFNFSADSVDKRKGRVNAILTSGLKPYGDMYARISVDPNNDKGDFDLTYKFEKISAPSFNPYLIQYTSFPLDRGTVELNGRWFVRNGIINSSNHVLVVDPRIAKRNRSDDVKHLPVPFVMALVRSVGDVIDYEVPVNGRLKHPHVNISHILYEIFLNILIKPPSTPYMLHVKKVVNEVDRYHSVVWLPKQHELTEAQHKFTAKLADFLKDHPDASISLRPVEYKEKEEENIMFFEAKRKYFLLINNRKDHYISEDDSVEIERMSVKDKGFIDYLNIKMGDSLMFTAQEKCRHFIGEKFIKKRYDHLLQLRKEAFLQAFKEAGVESRVKFEKHEDKVPFSGFSYFRLEYKGEIPEELTEAYHRLNDINDEFPRKKYKDKRHKKRYN